MVKQNNYNGKNVKKGKNLIRCKVQYLNISCKIEFMIKEKCQF